MRVLLLFLPPEGGSYSESEVTDASPPRSAVRRIAAADGPRPSPTSTARRGQYYMAEQMGAGVALFDYDNDGDLDVFLVQGGPLGRAGGPAAGAGPSRGCSATTSPTGRDGKRGAALHRRHRARRRRRCGYGMGAAVGDYDNDGDLDLFVTGFGADTLLSQQRRRHVRRRHGGGRRERSAVEHQRRVRRLRPRRPSRSVRRALSRLHDRRRTRSATTRSARATTAVRAPTSRCPRGCTATTATAGSPTSRSRPASARPTAPGLGVAAGDYNGDGWPDLYVANDATPNQLWINRQRRHLRGRGPALRRGRSMRRAIPRAAWGSPRATSTSTATRISSSPTSSARRSRSTPTTGRATSRTRARRAGLAAPTAAFTGFGTDWFDYDNDGRARSRSSPTAPST